MYFSMNKEKLTHTSKCLCLKYSNSQVLMRKRKDFPSTLYQTIMCLLVYPPRNAWCTSQRGLTLREKTLFLRLSTMLLLRLTRVLTPPGVPCDAISLQMEYTRRTMSGQETIRPVCVCEERKGMMCFHSGSLCLLGSFGVWVSYVDFWLYILN